MSKMVSERQLLDFNYVTVDLFLAVVYRSRSRDFLCENFEAKPVLPYTLNKIPSVYLNDI